MSETETVSTAAEAWIAGDMQGAQALNQPIPDEPAGAPSGDIPAYLENHLAVQKLEQKQIAAPDPAQAEAAMHSRVAAQLSGLGDEGRALVAEWGGQTSPEFKANLSYAKAAFADVAKNRPDLIAKVDASGLGNDPAILKVLSELGRQKAHTMGDFTSQRNRNSETQRPMPQNNSAAQRELDKIYKDTPPGSEGYKARSVQDRVMQLNEMIHGTEPVIGLGGRTA